MKVALEITPTVISEAGNKHSCTFRFCDNKEDTCRLSFCALNSQKNKQLKIINTAYNKIIVYILKNK